MRRRHLRGAGWILAAAALFTSPRLAEPADWPMWRYDAARRASSDEELAEKLHLLWILELPEPRPAWPATQDKLQFDQLYEPVLAGKSLFVPSMLSDKVTAYDTETAAERWSYYTGGPVRFAPAVWQGKVYAASDDGYLYCLDAADGALLWKFRGGPSDRKVLGNGRLVSSWPARGAPVVLDGKVYFGASIWPFMGVFIHALDAETGGVVWSNTGSGSAYLTQQHDSPAFAGVAPQGYMAATEDHLVVAGGRTLPAVYDRHTGKYIHFNVASRKMGSKGGGGYGVILSEDFYINNGGMYRFDNGHFVLNVDAPIFTDYAMIALGERGGIRGLRHTWKEMEYKDRKGKTQKRTFVPRLWSAALDQKIGRLFIKSGSRLYASGEKGAILAIDLPRLDRGSRVSWSVEIPDKPLNMISGDGKLFVSTEHGKIYCFGDKPGDVVVPGASLASFVPRGAEWKYLDDGSDQGTAWRARGFDDAQWPSGPAVLGYGNGGERTALSFGKDSKRKTITYYFRRKFEVPRDYHFGDVSMKVLVDDGAVIYLNEREIGRLFLPDGEIKGDTLARTGTDEKTYYDVKVTPSDLKAGTNVLAVEVHQISSTSSDVSFDLELKAKRLSLRQRLPGFPKDRWTTLAGTILGETGTTGGYCLALGIGTGRLVEELASQSKLSVIAIDPDRRKVDAFRRRIDGWGVYGARIAALVGEALTLDLPPYMANLVVSEDPRAAGLERGESFVRAVFRTLRPYSGAAAFAMSREEFQNFARTVEACGLDRGSVEHSGYFTLLRRLDAPTGSGVWTHQYADAANTAASSDQLVKAPLGLLWFGGPSHAGVLPRHGHGPTPQVAGGRLFIEGRDMIRATDIYTGRLLWERELKDVGKNYDYTSHEPGANAIGSNYVSMSDGIYVVHNGACLRLDPGSGRTLSEFRLPASEGEKGPPDWGYVAVSENLLIAGAKPTALNPAHFTDRELAGLKGDQLKKAVNEVKNWVGFTPTRERVEEEEDKKKAQAKRTKAEAQKQEVANAKPESAEETKKREEEARKKKEEEEKRWKEKISRIYFIANANKLLMGDGMLAMIPKDVRNKFKDKDKEKDKQKQVEKLEKDLETYLSEIPGRKGSDHRALVIKRQLLHLFYGFPKYEDRPAGKFDSRLRTGSKKLVVLDRHSGQPLWKYEAAYEMRHNAIAVGGGKIFIIDRLPDVLVALHKRRGLPVRENARVAALDALRGNVVWEAGEPVFGTWLSYSREHDVLLEAGSQGRDRSRDEVGQGMVAYRGATGDVLWKNDDSYSGPCILIGDSVITQGYGSSGHAYDLLTGKRKTRLHPISGKPIDWRYRRNYGCSSAIGCPNMLTFRSAAAGYYDLAGDSGTGNFGGFRAGCTSNLIPAGGILCIPDYTRTCTCSYQIQTSLALVHMPDAEMWTFNAFRHDGQPVERTGWNFGAPGDRMGPSGTLWLDYPSVGGLSPDLPLELFVKDPEYPRRHSSRIEEGELAWVAASALKGSGELVVKLLPSEKMVAPNEVSGRNTLVTENGTVSAAVPARRLPGAENLASLRKGNGRGDIKGTIEGYEGLASPSLTVEFWVRTDAEIDYVDARVSGKRKHHGFVIDNRALRVRYFIANGAGDNNEKEVVIEGKERIKDHRWVHVAFTYDAPSGVGTLYADGKSIGRHDGPDGRPLWWDSPQPDLIVLKGATEHSYMDELRICGRALDPKQFLRSGEVPVEDEKILGYWRMESAAGRSGQPRTGASLYTVRLVFAELEGLGAGERVFDVSLQEREVLEDFDISREAGAPYRTVTRSFDRVAVHDFLRIRLTPKGGRKPLLNGLQVIVESANLADDMSGG